MGRRQQVVIMDGKKEGIMILMTMKSLSQKTITLTTITTLTTTITLTTKKPLASVVRDPHLQDLLLEKTKGAKRKSKLEQLEIDSNTPFLAEAKRITCPLDLPHEKYHACINDCIMYRKEHVDKTKCPVCDAERYKKRKKKAPQKVVWYFPLAPRLQRFYADRKEAKLMRWHAERKEAVLNDEERIEHPVLTHPSDASQWKALDNEFGSFGAEPRNIRLGASTDGFNPFGNQSSTHSTWPVFVWIYNLPPWLCMKRKYIQMSMLIEGPTQPGNDINMYLELLKEELETLWAEEGVDTWDAVAEEYFPLRAALITTVQDYLGYGYISCQVCHGHKACVRCMEETMFLQLGKDPGSSKTVYMGHRRWLQKTDPWRKRGDLFDGTNEPRGPPRKKSGEEIDTLLKGVKVPFGYSGIISRYMDPKKRNFSGMKSHDCHVMMTQILPVAIRGIMDDHVRATLTGLCNFFDVITRKSISVKKLARLQEEIVVILCELEMYFPPAFFDVMVHLLVHIMDDIISLGPAFLHNMMPFERMNGVIKGYVRNRSHPDGSIVQGWLTEECISFCTNYLDIEDPVGLLQNKHLHRFEGVGHKNGRKELHVHMSGRTSDFDRANLVALQHIELIDPWLKEHKTMIENSGKPMMTEAEIYREHNSSFARWFKDHIDANPPPMDSDKDKLVLALSHGPAPNIMTYQAYDINGYTFYTEEKDKNSVYQNSGVIAVPGLLPAHHIPDSPGVYLSPANKATSQSTPPSSAAGQIEFCRHPNSPSRAPPFCPATILHHSLDHPPPPAPYAAAEDPWRRRSRAPLGEEVGPRAYQGTSAPPLEKKSPTTGLAPPGSGAAALEHVVPNVNFSLLDSLALDGG
ncbi:hypothetical protein QYE76_051954 [Lolium multiflorum]|uniref:DUF4218 domain-containing protein n=1 Tax=Lolium multiflorum TaxID=4521 RepID=A0AAD8SUC2_LOLMU|nr:hypothetical protein QYE76_051954 [Lolium multiflorum]